MERTNSTDDRVTPSTRTITTPTPPTRIIGHICPHVATGALCITDAIHDNDHPHEVGARRHVRADTTAHLTRGRRRCNCRCCSLCATNRSRSRIVAAFLVAVLAIVAITACIERPRKPVLAGPCQKTRTAGNELPATNTSITLTMHTTSKFDQTPASTTNASCHTRPHSKRSRSVANHARAVAATIMHTKAVPVHERPAAAERIAHRMPSLYEKQR